MRFDQLTPELQLFARRFIRRKARRLVAKPGFSRSDQEDIEQDLMVHLLERLQNYEPGRGTPFGFVTAVVDRQAANVLERHRAAKRGLGRCQPLCTVPSETEPSDEPICSGGQDATALRLDMEQVLRRLPVELQKLCILLKTESAAETARLLGISARTLYRRRKRVRMFLADAGFGADCGFLCASSRAVPVVT